MSALALGLRLNAARGQRSLMARAISAIRRNGGTALYVPDDYGLVLGPELNTTGTAGWTTYSASQSIAGNTITVTSSGGFGGIYKNFPTEIGKRYLVVSESSNGTSNSATIKASVASLANTTTGLQTLRPSFAATVTSTPINLELGSTMGVGTFTAPSVREIISATSFIDSTGTQPVTAINDLVGLLTDRSYGAGNLGGEITGGLTTPANWSNSGGATINAGVLSLPSASAQSININAVVPAKTYRITFTVSDATSGLWLNVYAGATQASGVVQGASNGTKTVHIKATTAAGIIFQNDAGSTGTCTISAVEVREVLGNHASQPTPASKPIVTRVPKRLGPNLVTNGGFDSGTTGWSIEAGGTIANVSGTLEISGAGFNAYQSVAVSAGKSYQVSYTPISNGNQCIVSIGHGIGQSQLYSVGSLTTQQTFTVAPASSLMFFNVKTLGDAARYDNISVQEVLEWTPALKFDGSNDSLSLSGPLLTSEATYIFAGTCTNLASYPVLLGQAANGLQVLLNANGSVTVSKVGAGMDLSSSAGVVVSGVPFVLSVVVVAGGTSRIFVNGTQVGSGTQISSPLAATTLFVGFNGTGGFAASNVSDEMIAPVALPDADRILIETNMARRARAQYAVSTPTLSLDFTTGSYSVSDGEI